MKSSLNHLQVNVDYEKNGDFYKGLFEFLGWEKLHEDHEVVGYKSNDISLWFYHTPKQEIADYDKYGVNHIGIKVENQSDVDDVMKFLEAQNVEMLFDTPRHRPEYVSDSSETYYQIMFESPDKILFEILYSGKK